MTDEDRQKTIDFILEQQAQFSVNMESMRENMEAMHENMEVMRENIDGLREAQARTDAAVGALTTQVQNIARQQEHLNEVVAVIVDAQQHTDERLNALIDVVQQGRNGKG